MLRSEVSSVDLHYKSIASHEHFPNKQTKTNEYIYTLEFLLGLPEPLQLREILVQYEDLGEAQSGHLIGMSGGVIRAQQMMPLLLSFQTGIIIINFPFHDCGTAALSIALAPHFIFKNKTNKFNTNTESVNNSFFKCACVAN